MKIPLVIKKLAAAKKATAALEKQVARSLNKELSGLPAAYGFNSMEMFIWHLRQTSPRRTILPKGNKRYRAVVTPAMRTKAGQMRKDGQPTRVISEQLGIAIPTVYNILKSLGLVKSRKAPKPAKKTRKKAGLLAAPLPES